LPTQDANTEALFNVPKHQSLADIAYQVMVEAIVNQQFEPGSQIKIDTLARKLDMSNTPVREALMRATGERLVRQQSNRGFIVTSILTPKELQELFEVRYLIEMHSLKTGEITDQAIHQLERLVARMDAVGDGLVYQDFKDYLYADHLFHQVIVGLPGNNLLIKSWEALYVHLHLSRLYTGVGLFDRGDSTHEHSSLVNALRRRDRDEALRHLRLHIRGVKDRLLTFLQTP
jgi:DNA-binding GntR family transcriptional regulator